MTALSPTVELYLGSTLGWVDVTTHARQEAASSGGGTTITRGRSNGAAVSEPGSASLVLADPDGRGRYSPRNPNSDLYGLIGRNTPVRVRLPQADPGTAVALPGVIYTAGAGGPRVTAPDDVSLRITGDLDVRFWGRHPGNWATPGGFLIAGKYEITGNQRSWFLSVGPDRHLRFAWSPDGASISGTFWQSSTAIVPGVGGELAVRATLDVNNGAGGYVLTFWQAPNLAGPWTQVGSVVTGSSTTSIYAGTGTLEIGGEASVGGDSFAGELLGFELRNGIGDTAPVVASPDFTAMEVGDTSVVVALGRTYTLDDGALVVDRGARFYGEVSSWPPRWTLTGTDVWVPIQAAGITRRLGQGSSPVQSPLFRTFLAADPAAYLPLEDGAKATRPSSSAAGVAFGEASGVTFGIAGELDGAAAVAKLDDTTSVIRSSVTSRTSSTWSVFFLFKLAQLPASATYEPFIRLHMSGGTVATWEFGGSDAAYRWQGLDPWGTVVTQHDTSFGVDPDDWVVMRLQFVQSGSDISWGPLYARVGATTFLTSSWTAAGATLGTPVSVELLGGNHTKGAMFSHLVVGGDVIDLVNDQFRAVVTGYDGETAGQRIYRLCAENGVPVIMQGPPVYTEQMGPQGVGTLLDLLREAEAVDGGVLTEARGQLALQYRPRATLYNQTGLPLSYAAKQLSPPFEPTDDDQGTRNDVSVERRGGASYRAVQTTGPLSVLDPPDGVGRYDTSVTLPLYSDDQVQDHAWWRLHLGTVDEARWPRIGINLRGPAWEADPALTQQAALVDAGDLVTVDDLPPWVPPGPAEALVQGYTETIDSWRWEIQWTAVPASPYRVFEVGDPELGRVDTGGSELAAAAASGDTILRVATTDGPGWIEDPEDWPLDVAVGGERITVSAIYPAALDQFARLATAGWGTSTTGQAWTTTGGSAADYSVGGG